MRFKKIRGWKRRAKQLEEWKNDSISLDIDSIREYEVEYRKIFNFDECYFIPNWFKRNIVSSFIDILKQWETQAQSEFENFYIRLHINETDVFDSEIMIVILDSIEEYKSKFEKVDEHLQRPEWIINVVTKEWIPFYSYSVWLKDEFDSLSDSDRSKLIKNSVKVNDDDNAVNSDDELKEYIVRDSIFWCLDSEKDGTK